MMATKVAESLDYMSGNLKRRSKAGSLATKSLRWKLVGMGLFLHLVKYILAKNRWRRTGITWRVEGDEGAYSDIKVNQILVTWFSKVFT